LLIQSVRFAVYITSSLFSLLSPHNRSLFSWCSVTICCSAGMDILKSSIIFLVLTSAHFILGIVVYLLPGQLGVCMHLSSVSQRRHLYFPHYTYMLPVISHLVVLESLCILSFLTRSCRFVSSVHGCLVVYRITVSKNAYVRRGRSVCGCIVGTCSGDPKG